MPGKEKIVPVLSLPLAAFIIIASATGLLTPGFYAKETRPWAIQSTGQDAIDLFFIAPLLMAVTILVYQKNKTALPIWAGVNLYLAYTFAIYCFDVHFNRLFLFYCFCLGLSAFSFLYFLIVLKKESPGYNVRQKTPLRFIGIYFIIISVLFYLLWLADIFPSLLYNKIPDKLVETGLITNPVEILDLSLILPCVFTTGILLLNGKSMGFVLTPVLLSFIILMDVTLSVMNLTAYLKGMSTDTSIAFVMGMLAIFSIVLLIIFFINITSRNLKYYNNAD